MGQNDRLIVIPPVVAIIVPPVVIIPVVMMVIGTVLHDHRLVDVNHGSLGRPCAHGSKTREADEGQAEKEECFHEMEILTRRKTGKPGDQSWWTW